MSHSRDRVITCGPHNIPCNRLWRHLLNINRKSETTIWCVVIVFFCRHWWAHYTVSEIKYCMYCHEEAFMLSGVMMVIIWRPQKIALSWALTPADTLFSALSASLWSRNYYYASQSKQVQLLQIPIMMWCQAQRQLPMPNMLLQWLQGLAIRSIYTGTVAKVIESVWPRHFWRKQT